MKRRSSRKAAIQPAPSAAAPVRRDRIEESERPRSSRQDESRDPVLSGLKRRREEAETREAKARSQSRFWFEKPEGAGDGSALLPRSILFAAVLGGLVGAVIVFVGILVLTTMVAKNRDAPGLTGGGLESDLDGGLGGGGGPLTILLSEFPGQLGLGLDAPDDANIRALSEPGANGAGVTVPAATARQLHHELEILKVRNRLTLLADRAIGEADRRAYEQLRAAAGNPEFEDFRFSVGSELMRVQFFYASGSRLEGVVLPMDDLFPGTADLREDTLSDESVRELLLDLDRPWQIRGRAAWILGGREPDEESLAALVEGVRTDPNLDVLKECLYSIEELTGMRGHAIFDTNTILEWWDAHRSGPPSDLAGTLEGGRRPRSGSGDDPAPGSQAVAP